jgi:hypothetical protein
VQVCSTEEILKGRLKEQAVRQQAIEKANAVQRKEAFKRVTQRQMTGLFWQ